MTTNTPETDTTPRVWIGCLACYNAGRLVGDWYDAASADEVTTYDIHGAHTRADSHDELWCMDHENLPISGECSPHEAARLAQVIMEVPNYERDAFIAWIRSGDYIEGGDNLPSVGDFEDRYCGQWPDFAEYAQNLADDIGLLRETPEEIARYFDWSSWIRDLAFDYTTHRADDGGVYVFRSF